MTKYSIEVAVIISIIVYLILPFIGIKGIAQIIIMGFVATYITVTEKTSYKIGAIAAGAIGTLFAFYSFFTGPDLPYQLPNPLQLGLGVAVDSFFTIIMGLIISILIYVALGAIGGYIAELFLSDKKPKKQAPKKHRRDLNRVEYF
ncbi:DUF5518 domain-containing protein [Methanobacterium aggregans]|uniref:DUF5518 domain-containing protein n=1 Tax=Methanobacterium aggregans TaxID=1615586 RepID=UPI001AE76764|nr:DUF5518 domain-containing protein [Methanobacterium aggregans]MBP2046780.1 hypothetical protein [Methanobacterium aggregans]